ncbi:hypothetical protein [Aequorivita sublithincola]|uniref:hypothetical protein n=1 Tax=Aequorivita sublithincola TaxID=101385 RepID=UPI0002D581D9|nr:hypothetical protein [Aequorivita sublithincola]
MPSQKEFLLSIEAKETDVIFTGDMVGQLSPDNNYDQKVAFEWLKDEIISKK